MKEDSGAPRPTKPSNQESSKEIKNLETKIANAKLNEDGSAGQLSTSDTTEGDTASQKSKAELRRERREKQLAEKAAKAAAKAEKATHEGSAPNTPNTPKQPAKPQKPQKQQPKPQSILKQPADKPTTQAKAPPKTVKIEIPKESEKTPETAKGEKMYRKKKQLLQHLPRKSEDTFALTKSLGFYGAKIHPEVIRVGLAINEGLITGSNARCAAMLYAIKKTIQDFQRSPDKEFTRDLLSRITDQVDFLNKSRPLSVSMANAVRYLTSCLTKMADEQLQSSGNVDEEAAKKKLAESIDEFIEVEIILAQKGICNNAIQKISKDDTILTFGCSEIIKHVLYEAKVQGKKFNVVVVDSRPRLSGRHLADFLHGHKINVQYIFINAIGFIMKDVTKVFLGAHSLLANGHIMSQIGSSQIAMVASSYNVPVLVCCETYKFSEKADTDSFVHNELASNDQFFSKPYPNAPIATREELEKTDLLNLVYDVTPPDFVTAIITERGIHPCNTVPAVLREKQDFR